MKEQQLHQARVMESWRIATAGACLYEGQRHPGTADNLLDGESLWAKATRQK